VTILDALDDAALFKPQFGAPPGDTWRMRVASTWRESINDTMAVIEERAPRLGQKERKLLERWADLAFSGLSQVTFEATARDQELEEVRQVSGAPGAEPWLNFAVDLRFAEEVVGRYQAALERYAELRRAHLPSGLSPRSRRCVAEATQTFLFTFMPHASPFSERPWNKRSRTLAYVARSTRRIVFAELSGAAEPAWAFYGRRAKSGTADWGSLPRVVMRSG
jgi:hypothetical protein